MNNVERKILDKCNFVLCATSQIYKDVKSLKKKNIHLIKNGFLKNEKKIVRESKNDSKIVIGYFGLISDSSKGYRDIKVIHNSLKSNNKIQFSFYIEYNAKDLFMFCVTLLFHNQNNIL